MDQHLLTVVIYAHAASDVASLAKEIEASAISQKLWRTSAEIAEASRIIVADTRETLQAAGVIVAERAPSGIDLIENDYQIAVYTGAPELADEQAYLVEPFNLFDLAAHPDEPQLIGAVSNSATAEVSTIKLEQIELFDGSIVLTGKALTKYLSGTLIAALLSVYGAPFAAEHIEQLKAQRDTDLIQPLLREDPLIRHGRCSLKLGHVINLEVLTNHARLAYDYEGAETDEIAQLRICNLQVALHTLGYQIVAIDGVFGPNTKDAWERFRAKHADDIEDTPDGSFCALLRLVAQFKARRAEDIRYERSHLG